MKSETRDLKAKLCSCPSPTNALSPCPIIVLAAEREVSSDEAANVVNCDDSVRRPSLDLESRNSKGSRKMREKRKENREEFLPSFAALFRSAIAVRETLQEAYRHWRILRRGKSTSESGNGEFGVVGHIRDMCRLHTSNHNFVAFGSLLVAKRVATISFWKASVSGSKIVCICLPDITCSIFAAAPLIAKSKNNARTPVLGEGALVLDRSCRRIFGWGGGVQRWFRDAEATRAGLRPACFRESFFQWLGP